MMQVAMQKFILVFGLLFGLFVFPQKEYPQDFVSPLDIPLLLSGTFGELRSNHFHSGIDIKTQRKQGLKVYAIGDGYVSRIKVSLWGFGKALYITHPNGYTSVYAHLQKFAPEIEAYVKAQQYKQESFELELFPTVNTLKVTKKQVVAFSGNTGGSAGPHLHFEVRDTATEKPINPLFFGYQVKDEKKPVIQAAFAYPMLEDAHVNQSNRPVNLNFKPDAAGVLVADKIFALGKIGFGINSYDGQDLTYNRNGLYEVTTYVNGAKKHSYDFESFSFAETRYINTFIDYKRYKEKKQRVQRLYKTAANVLSIYNGGDDGFFNIKEGLSYDIRVEVVDFHGNKTVLRIPVEGKKMPILYPTDLKTTDKFVLAQRDNLYQIDQHSVFFPKNTFYENFYLELENHNDSIRVHHDKIPVRKRYTLSMDASAFPIEQHAKMFIANLNRKGKPSYNRTYKKEQTFSIKTRTLGTFFFEQDTIAPTVQPANFQDGKWLSNYSYLRVKILDDLSGINTYQGTVDGQWILFEYEPKTKMLTYNFSDKKFEGTKHELELIVTDNVGNSTTFTSTFFRKE